MDHTERMQRKKEIIDGKVAEAVEARGVFLIHTGTGKGKSTAAFGLLARALGHGMTAAVVQFIKSRTDTGEEGFFRGQPGVHWHVMGEGFTWDTQDDAKDAAAARAAWEMAKRYLADSGIGNVVLDEFTYALKYRWLDTKRCSRQSPRARRCSTSSLTGRAALPALVEAADTVTEMALVKHAFHAGVQAMPGIEF